MFVPLLNLGVSVKVPVFGGAPKDVLDRPVRTKAMTKMWN